MPAACWPVGSTMIASSSVASRSPCPYPVRKMPFHKPSKISFNTSGNASGFGRCLVSRAQSMSRKTANLPSAPLLRKILRGAEQFAGALWRSDPGLRIDGQPLKQSKSSAPSSHSDAASKLRHPAGQSDFRVILLWFGPLILGPIGHASFHLSGKRTKTFSGFNC